MPLNSEKLIESILNQYSSNTLLKNKTFSVSNNLLNYNYSKTRVVVLGGGTGLSTVIGGNSQNSDWPYNPFTGLKKIFQNLNVIVCTTDDGKSSGEFLKQLPIIGIGDIRKVCLSMILPYKLKLLYNINDSQANLLLQIIHLIFNYRFAKNERSIRFVKNPLLTVPPVLRKFCPKDLKDLFISLGSSIISSKKNPSFSAAGHCLGNFLIISAIFKQSNYKYNKPPTAKEIYSGINIIAKAIGANPNYIHPASTVQGQLVVRYANGVQVYGQHKLSISRRYFAVERIAPEFISKPVLSIKIKKIIREADLIIIAPGSLYTSSIPVLQVPGLAEEIAENKKALKILGANFWVEKGETDITSTDLNRGFRVSELIEAYNRNLKINPQDLFHIVLSANLENIPGNLLRNYALEGKIPILLDRIKVKNMSILPIEASIFSLDNFDAYRGAVHHDPEKFTLTISALLSQKKILLNNKNKYIIKNENSIKKIKIKNNNKMFLCDYMKMINKIITSKNINSLFIKNILIDLIWENRNIKIKHLSFFAGIKIIQPNKWNRSTEWDNILGYYDPKDKYLKINCQLLKDEKRLKGNILIALGESLLGNYIQNKYWLEPKNDNLWGFRIYQIKLRKSIEREIYLNENQLHYFLKLARMTKHPFNKNIFQITLNNDEGFIPPGLLFGLLYGWYLNNTYEPIMDNELGILHCHKKSLIPHQYKEYIRQRNLIDFFRNEIF